MGIIARRRVAGEHGTCKLECIEKRRTCVEWRHEKKQAQLLHRVAPPLIRHILESVRTGHVSASTAAEELGLSRNRLYQLLSDYLAAYGPGIHRSWVPGVSGGDHAPVWPATVTTLLRKRLSSDPAASYSFAASEALRLCGYRLDRAQVRRWAMANGLSHGNIPRRPLAPVRRWQRSQIGELWQLDATPHRWFPPSNTQFPMLNMLDDCSRVFVGSKVYTREIIPAYLDFLPAAFLAYGLPLELYVDYHSFFFTQVPEALTTLGTALRFYGISLRFAPTPQAKGKVEREHHFWQQRLPAYFASEPVTDLLDANNHITALRLHHNQHETHRELKMTPGKAWAEAEAQNRSVLRTPPACPWWPFVWSERSSIRTGSDGRVPIGAHSVRLESPPGSKVILCHHTDGHHSVLVAPPKLGTLPILLFTNRRK